MNLTPEQIYRVLQLMNGSTDENPEDLLNVEPVQLSPELQERLLKIALNELRKSS